jgi:cell division protein FtsN
LRRSRQIYKRKTRSNLETLIILIGAIVILSVAFYLARERSYLPPEELVMEQKTVFEEEITPEQKASEELIAQGTPTGEKPAELKVPETAKPPEREISSQPEEQVSQKIGDSTAGQTVTEATKAEVTVSKVEPAPPSGLVYTVQVGYFSIESNARGLAKEIEQRGYTTFVIKHNNAFKVQVGAYSSREQAEKAAQELKKLGYEIWITQR